MANLFIIGNGFDLAHRLETDYKAFRDFCFKMSQTDNIGEMSERFVATIEKVKARISKKYRQIENIMESLPPDVVEHRIKELKLVLEDCEAIINWANFGTNDFNESALLSSYSLEIIECIKPKEIPFSRNFILENHDDIRKAFFDFFQQILFTGMDSSSETSIDAENVFFPPEVGTSILIELIDGVTGGNWNDFERALGDFCLENLLKVFSFDDDVWKEISSDDGVAILSELAVGLFSTIRIPFFLWMQEFNVISALPKSDFVNLIKQGDYFFSTNYTHTLEDVYNIDNVCHIHGVIDSEEAALFRETGMFDINRLIIGHGNGELEILSKSSESVSISAMIDKHANNYFKKPVEKCIKRYSDFFNSLGNVDSIYSFGFSFSDVDMPYISKICDSIGDTSKVIWYLNDYDSKEHEIYKKKIVANGFTGQFDTFHID